MIAVRIEPSLSGALEDLDGLVVRLRAPKAFPPGQPLAFVLTGGDAELRLEARSIGSKRRDDGSFEVRARLVNLRKETREALEQVWQTRASIERG